MDLGLSEQRFWDTTPRELEAFYRAKATVEARWRFYMSLAMGAKHKSGRQLQLADFLPPESRPKQTWQEQLDAVKSFMTQLKAYS